jgi:hypothetical protein
LKPKVLILVGQMAINRFLGPGRLEDRVGQKFGERPVIVPLPHPSGQSRWLNDPANRERLASALAIVGALRSALAPTSTSRSNSDGGPEQPHRARRAMTRVTRRQT